MLPESYQTLPAETIRWISLNRWMFTSRQVDWLSLGWVRQGLAFFHAPSLGLESNAALARYLTPADWLNLHCRNTAQLLARGYLLSQGRLMNAHFSERNDNVLSQIVPAGNQVLQAVGIAASICGQLESPIVGCSVGDGTAQQGDSLEAVAEAVHWQLPVLLLVPNNRYGISTKFLTKSIPHSYPLYV